MDHNESANKQRYVQVGLGSRSEMYSSALVEHLSAFQARVQRCCVDRQGWTRRQR